MTLAIFRRSVLAVALACAAAAAVPAQEFDMKDYSCAQLAKEDQDTIAYLLFWADGYLSGRTGDTRFDVSYLETMAQHIDTYCAEHPDTRLIDALDDLMGE